MIVVDANILAHTWLPSDLSSQTKDLIELDPEWIAPTLWRSEFRSILGLYIRKGLLSLQKAVEIAQNAEDQLLGREFEIPSHSILQLMTVSNLSAYDSEYVALAQAKDVHLITLDKGILREFPEVAFTMKDYLSR